MTRVEEVQLMLSYLSGGTNAVHSTTQFSHTVMSMTTLVQLILTRLLVKDDILAEQVIVAENYGGAQHRQALLEPHQFFPEAPWVGHLHVQPGRGQRVEEGEDIDKRWEQ